MRLRLKGEGLTTSNQLESALASYLHQDKCRELKFHRDIKELFAVKATSVPFKEAIK